MLLVFFLSLCAYVLTLKSSMKARRLPPEFKNLESCLKREYNSFFDPLERDYYDANVEFIDPLGRFIGINKYQDNVDFLAGRSGLGSFLFKNSFIRIFSVEQLEDSRIMTRWALHFTFIALPWQPTARFSGVSLYTVNNDTKIIKQEDYWDSINLNGGKYEEKNRREGFKDFLSQLRQDTTAEMVAPELPYELLRRGKYYDVRKYPPHIVAETEYSQRPEGYDRLGSYVRGSNFDR
jgi:hypothetical protein